MLSTKYIYSFQYLEKALKKKKKEKDSNFLHWQSRVVLN